MQTAVASCAILFITVLLPEGETACCRSGLKKEGAGADTKGATANGKYLCYDCTYPTPCCSTGQCNIFCCNCDGQCRGGCRVSRALGWSTLYENTGTGGHDVIQDGDLDGDGRLSFEEAHHYVSKRSLYDADEAERMLTEMDVDNDNFFSPEEIDY